MRVILKVMGMYRTLTTNYKYLYKCYAQFIIRRMKQEITQFLLTARFPNISHNKC